MDDCIRWNLKYSSDRAEREVNANLKRAFAQLTRGRVLDLAGGVGQNSAWLAAQDKGFWVVVTDVSDVALERVGNQCARVQADARCLPFAPASFATILCIRYFEAQVDFAALLAPGGTVFFESFTTADKKYHPTFNPAHRLNMAQLGSVFKGLEILRAHEFDDGHRVSATVIARKPIQLAPRPTRA